MGVSIFEIIAALIFAAVVAAGATGCSITSEGLIAPGDMQELTRRRELELRYTLETHTDEDKRQLAKLLGGVGK